MTEAAIIAGSLVDVRNVGTHKSVKLTIHVPEEHAMRVVEAFGWPTGVNPISVAIARIDPNVVQRPETLNAAVEAPRPVPLHPLPAGAARERRAFADMRPAQQAGILCGEKAFKIFLLERFPDATFQARGEPSVAVRIICDVDSRRDITPDNAEWSALVLAYRLWQRECSVVPA